VVNPVRARIPQPPIRAATRNPEHHDFWPGFAVALIGGVLVFAGSRHMTALETVDGGTAWETQVIRAFAHGGMRYVPRGPAASGSPGNPVTFEGPLGGGADPGLTTSMVRIDTGAKTPCPT